MLPQPTKPPRPVLTGQNVLSAREVAELLHVPASTIFDHARRGLLPGHKLGRRWIFIRDELDTAVRATPTSAQAPASAPPAPTTASKRHG